MMKFIKGFLPHLAIAMLLGFIVLIILDGRNPLMAFITSDTSKVYMLIMCIVCLIVIISNIAESRKRGR